VKLVSRRSGTPTPGVATSADCKGVEPDGLTPYLCAAGMNVPHAPLWEPSDRRACYKMRYKRTNLNAVTY
jgi:hypothetical protein